VQRLKSSGVARDRFDQDLAGIAAQLGKHTRRAPKLDLPIFTHGKLANDNLSFKGVDHRVKTLAGKFIQRHRSIALSSFECENPGHQGVSAISVDFRKVLTAEINKKHFLSTVRDGDITDIHVIINNFSGETGADLTKLGVDYVVGGSYIFDGNCSLKFLIKIVNAHTGKVHRFEQKVEVWQNDRAEKLPTHLVYPR
ncbi:MAG: hypothetical protein HRT88_23170, partial [Lentisphaeraceae bacterium]|nr:hypothetical protein [Lentisphaeraceae bacterium]